MYQYVVITILLPLIFGLGTWLMSQKNNNIAPFFAMLITPLICGLSIFIFMYKPFTIGYDGIDLFTIDTLSAFIAIFISLFSLLTVIYSVKFMHDQPRLNAYYANILITLGLALGAVWADHLILFLTFWGLLGITLFWMLTLGAKGAETPAKKAFLIIGGSDALLLLGIALIWPIAPSLQMSTLSLPLTSGSTTSAFICFALAAFAKAGAIPLHTWIPDAADTTPAPVMAFIPASLDKLLGIYFLFRISVDLFAIQAGSAMSIFLLIIGAITIIGGVVMALIQHNIKKLLAFHAVSQVGYMIMGIGTANPVGIAGGLFHMLNHTIYKTALFMCGGTVESRTGTDHLSRLGGLAKTMPITFVTFLIAAFSISGVPPLNGFVSKWMVYQGILEMGQAGSLWWPLWLVAAMFGSALTMASFMKLGHAIFLGQAAEPEPAPEDTPAIRPKWEKSNTSMLIGPIFLAILCVLFGIAAIQIPLALFIVPALSNPLSFIGVWNGSWATILILLGLLIGLILFAISRQKPRQVEAFIGGESLSQFPAMKPSGVEFYNTVRELSGIKRLYDWGEHKCLDLYENLKRFFGYITGLLRSMHTGVLSSYVLWVLVGLIIFLFIFKTG